jgi:anti-anti-sigma factor
MQAAASSCEWDVERGPDWLLVRLRNLDLSDPDGPSVAEHLKSLLEQHFTHRLVLEMDEVEVLNSDLIGQLVQLYRWIEEHDGVMRLCGLSPANRQVLHTCRLDDRLLPYGDRQEAVMGRSHAAKPR